MKKIKLFEGFNKDSFYIELDIDITILDQWLHFRNLIFEPSESIYKKLSKIIDVKCESQGKITTIIQKNQSLNNRWGLGDILCIGIDRILRDSLISASTYAEIGVYSMDDEYYFVSYYTWSSRFTTATEFYKCDQFDGLVQFLKDKGII